MNTGSILLQSLKDLANSIRTVNPLDYGILVPKPIKPALPKSDSYVSEYANNQNDNEKAKEPSLITKETRAIKVQKFLEKRRGRKKIKKVRYQQRQKAADRKIRYKGRFVNLGEAKELIMKGEEVTANDSAYLQRLFDKYKEENLRKKFEENIRTNAILRTKRKFSLNTNVGTNSGSSPLIQTDGKGSFNANLKEQDENMEIEIPPSLRI